MLRREHIRTVILALLPVLVVPLYGQVSCNRGCPDSGNPCLVTPPGPDIDAGRCLYPPANGRMCDFPGTAGSNDGRCFDGECESDECVGLGQFQSCDSPMAGGATGACISDFCVSAKRVDECVAVGVGRINCCTQQGCINGRPSDCANPLHDVSCDPSNIQPPGLPGQAGRCDQGVCVPEGGVCEGVACAPNPNVCLRAELDLSTCACIDLPTDDYCPGGFCDSGACVVLCDNTPCEDLGLGECLTGQCDPSTGECIIVAGPDGTDCDTGVPGFCVAGVCHNYENYVEVALLGDPGFFQVTFFGGGANCCYGTPIEAEMAYPSSTTYVDPGLCDSYVDNTGDGRLRLDFVGGGGACCHDTVADVLAAYPDREICDARPDP